MQASCRSTFNPTVHLCPPRAPLLPATCSLDHRFLQRAPVVIKRTCKAGAGPPSRSYAPAAPAHTSPRPPLPSAPPPPSPGPSSAPLSAGLRSLWHRIFQLPAWFSGAFWQNFWSQKWGHRATPVLGPLLYFIPWVPKMGPPCDPKSGAQNFVIFLGGTAPFARTCGLFFGAACSASPGHLGVGRGRDDVLAGPSQRSFHVSLVTLLAQHASAKLLVEFSMDVAPQASL